MNYFDDLVTQLQAQGGIHYLATPYTHADPTVMEARCQAVTRAAGLLFARGVMVFSPITHAHPIKLAADLRTPWEAWAEYDRQCITRLCVSLLVLKLPGWDRSVGVTAELAIAEECCQMVRWLEPAWIGLEQRPATNWIANDYR